MIETSTLSHGWLDVRYRGVVGMERVGGRPLAPGRVLLLDFEVTDHCTYLRTEPALGPRCPFILGGTLEHVLDAFHDLAARVMAGSPDDASENDRDIAEALGRLHWEVTG